MEERRKSSKFDMLALALYCALRIDPQEKTKQVVQALEEVKGLLLAKKVSERDRYARALYED